MSDLFFGINMQKLLRLGVLDPGRQAQAHALPDDKLSSEELLFCRLWSSDMMRSQIHQKGETITRAGQTMPEAFIIFQGQAVATFQGTQFHLGPGAVIGLAEALAGQNCPWSVTANTIVHTRSIPIGPALEEVRQANPALRSICRVTVARILGLAQAPENL